jgi:8-oxo-dGTP diphosphatase
MGCIVQLKQDVSMPPAKKKSPPSPASPPTHHQPQACGQDFARPLVTVDVVIFTVQAQRLQVLLVRRPTGEGEPFPGMLALPGGFVDVERDATLLDCAVRKLRDKTGLHTHHLEQLGSWGSAGRDPRGWSVTQVYMALVPAPAPDAGTSATATAPVPTVAAPDTASTAQWLDVDTACASPLAFDHATLLNAALARLRSKVEYTSLPAFLLPEPFTLPQLQQVYEVVLGRALDKSAFRKRMLDSGFLAEAGTVDGTAPRKAMGYRIRDRSQATVFPRTFRSGES